MKVGPELADIIGELYESFVCKRALVIYKSQSEVVKVILHFVTF